MTFKPHFTISNDTFQSDSGKRPYRHTIGDILPVKAESHDESHGSHDEGDSPAPPSGGNINLETHNIPATLPSTISMDAQQQLAQARLNALSSFFILWLGVAPNFSVFFPRFGPQAIGRKNH